ncbi:MAG: LptF/LptG family permease [Kiritimatiellae bacterium]|nr:LptF/LptG family permease [Kiritimatiellia bacterium]
MSILFRYVLRSFALPATMCFLGLCALTLLFMSFDLIGACFDPKSAVTFTVACDFILGTLSMYLEWLLPAVFLLSTLYTMWQFCRHSELIAMRAGGIGMSTVTAPILLTALLAAIFSFVNTEYIKPTAAARAMIIKNSDFRTTGREPLKGRAYFEPTGKFRIVIGALDPTNPEHLKDVRVTFFREDGSQRVTYEAPEARWLDEEWWLQGGVKATYYNELDEVVAPPEGLTAFSSIKELYDLNVHPRQIIVQNSDAEFSSAADRKISRKERDRTGLTTRQKHEDSYATYNHYAAPFSILLVTLFAIPAGIASGRQSVFRGILLALGMFLAYYALTALAMLLANNGWVKPALAVMLPSIIFGSAALMLFRKLH